MRATNFTKDLFAAEASPYYAAFVEDTYQPTQALTITAGLRWDIFGGKTERHNRLEYFDPTASNTVNGVSYTGAEVYVNSGNRSPFDGESRRTSARAWASHGRPMSHLVVRGGGGFYYGPSPQMVGSAALDSDGFSSVTNWNATCLNADGNYRSITAVRPACERSREAPAPSFTGDYSLSNPFPNGVVPLSSTPCRAGNNLGNSAEHHAPFAAHAHHLQLQLRPGIRAAASSGRQRRIRGQPRTLPAPRRGSI